MIDLLQQSKFRENEATSKIVINGFLFDAESVLANDRQGQEPVQPSFDRDANFAQDSILQLDVDSASYGVIGQYDMLSDLGRSRGANCSRNNGSTRSMLSEASKK
jgi:hypothetical protein